MKFNFPETIFVAKNSGKEQCEHVLSEAEEVRRELEKGRERSIDQIDLELMDMLHSLETYFRIRIDGCGRHHVKELRRRVIEKNRERGYYR